MFYDSGSSTTFEIFFHNVCRNMVCRYETGDEYTGNIMLKTTLVLSKEVSRGFSLELTFPIKV